MKCSHYLPLYAPSCLNVFFGDLGEIRLLATVNLLTFMLSWAPHCCSTCACKCDCTNKYYYYYYYYYSLSFLKRPHSTHNDCRGALCFCCVALCKVALHKLTFSPLAYRSASYTIEENSGRYKCMKLMLFVHCVVCQCTHVQLSRVLSN